MGRVPLPPSALKAASKSISVQATEAVLQKAAFEPEVAPSGIESQLRDLESRCETLRESFHALNSQLWPVLDIMSPPAEYPHYVNCDSKAEASVSTAPYESRMRSVSNEMAALEHVLDDLRMRLRV